jgi:hypothetical protein
MRNLKGILINVYKQSAIDGGVEAHELDDIVDFGLPFIEAQLELVKKLNIDDVSKRVLKRICSGEKCNKEFDVELSIYADKTKAVSSIQMCPHCGGRNDIWIEMT